MRCLFALILLFAGLSTAQAAPQIVVDNLNYDFGEILQGEQVEQVFRFRNAGDQQLLLTNVRSSCGCTAALLSATRIDPGGIGELRTTFDSTSFKGAIQKTITVDTNDPQHPLVSFAVSGNVKPELLLQPERVNWQKVKADIPLNATVKIVNHSSQTISLQPPQVTALGVRADLSGQNLEPGEQVELHISAEFPIGKDRIRGYVIINSDYSKVPQLRVSVSARLAK